MFKDRHAAGVQLAEALKGKVGPNPLILAIPRGGVQVAYTVWERLGGDLDITQPRKIGSPFNPELAVGAVAPDGTRLIDDRLVDRLGISSEYLEREAERERLEAQRRLRLYRGDRPFPCPAGRQVVLVDDGVATGTTALLALRLLKQQGPERLILAVPVAPPETVERLVREADEVVCLLRPEYFQAVGEFYLDFSPVEDREVINLLKAAWRQNIQGKV
ncbi:MAG: putative phosphoribosyl transferase [Bacillota bacterium]|jgi:putative phosphoribosyl transferase|nr:putative phosphoribosyl transferase [Bacillota bacterium]MDK2924803.1 putative phosphoribosyl transferase [Bacillota bacterium]